LQKFLQTFANFSSIYSILHVRAVLLWFIVTTQQIRLRPAAQPLGEALWAHAAHWVTKHTPHSCLYTWSCHYAQT